MTSFEICEPFTFMSQLKGLQNLAFRHTCMILHLMTFLFGHIALMQQLPLTYYLFSSVLWQCLQYFEHELLSMTLICLLRFVHIYHAIIIIIPATCNLGFLLLQHDWHCWVRLFYGIDVFDEVCIHLVRATNKNSVPPAGLVSSCCSMTDTADSNSFMTLICLLRFVYIYLSCHDKRAMKSVSDTCKLGCLLLLHDWHSWFRLFYDADLFA